MTEEFEQEIEISPFPEENILSGIPQALKFQEKGGFHMKSWEDLAFSWGFSLNLKFKEIIKEISRFEGNHFFSWEMT